MRRKKMETKANHSCLARLIFLSLSFGAILNAAAAPADIDFFRGKTVTYIVATKTGGGYDTYARLIARYLQKNLSGSKVIVKNVPGAGHIIGANTVYQAAPDGLTIGTFNTGLIYAQIIGQEGIQFDLNKFSWIGKANSETRVYVVGANAPYKTFKDILDSKETIKMPSSGVGSQDHNETVILGAALAAKFKPVPGYSGKEAEMAILRGEVPAIVGSYTGLMGMVTAKEGRVLMQYGSQRAIPGLERVPHIDTFEASPSGKSLIKLVNSIDMIGRLTAAPPGLQAGRLQVLRDAYKKALTDPELIKDAKKYSLDLDPAYGDDVQKLIADGINQPAENIKMLKDIIKFGE
jgi:tripartite-type tricarboxylate transporter receptor subunit TctC